MISKAAILIQQLNNLITDLESHEDKELDELKKQLDAVNRAISTLKASDLSIPQDLIDTQGRLQADVLDRDEVSVVLAFLKDELEKIFDRVRRLEKTQRSVQTASVKSVRAGTTTNRSSLVSRDTLRKTLIESLKALGGSAPKAEVEDEMEMRLRSILTDGDYEPVGEGIPSWRKRAEWVRYQLVQEGILKDNSPRGIWELK